MVPPQPSTAPAVPGNCKWEHWVLCPPHRAVLCSISGHIPRSGQLSGARGGSAGLARGTRLLQPLALPVPEWGGSCGWSASVPTMTC